MSQDPVFWEIAQSPDGIAVLRNPQAQNSYSYGQNNPIVNKDPDGRIAFLAIPVVAATITAFEYFGYAMAAVDAYNFTNVVRYPEGYSPAEIDDAGNRLYKDMASGGIGRLAGRTIESGMNTFDALYETGSYYGGKIKNKINNLPTNTNSPNIYQTTPSSSNTNSSRKSSQTYISAPKGSSSSNKSSNLNTALL